MDIKKLDKNFIQNEISEDENEYYIENFNTPFSLNGIFYDKQYGYLRMPESNASEINIGVKGANYMTSGGRLRFSTNSSFLDIDVSYDNLIQMTHMPLSGSCGFTLCRFNGDKEEFVMTLMPEVMDKTGYKKRMLLNTNEMREYVLYFPLYNSVKKLRLGFEKGSIIGKGRNYKDIPPIVYYGSSITQGGCASRPDLCYQALICKKNNVDYINLGFSGWALGEEKMAEYIASLDSSLYVMDYDHNASIKELKETHYNFYKVLRNKRPNTPILMISRPDYIDNDNCKERYKIIKETYDKAIENGDSNVYIVNGKELFYGKFDICTVDSCHPVDTGFYFMAEYLINTINEILKN